MEGRWGFTRWRREGKAFQTEGINICNDIEAEIICSFGETLNGFGVLDKILIKNIEDNAAWSLNRHLQSTPHATLPHREKHDIYFTRIHLTRDDRITLSHPKRCQGKFPGGASV